MLASASKLGWGYEYLLPVAPTLDPAFILSQMSRPLPIRLVPDALPALHHSRAGIIASGTATVEAALMSLPFVMVYRVSPLTYFLGKPRVKVSHFAMVNLIAGDAIVPELIQHDFAPDKVVRMMNEILPNGPAREQMLNGFERVKSRLQGDDRSGRHA